MRHEGEKISKSMSQGETECKHCRINLWCNPSTKVMQFTRTTCLGKFCFAKKIAPSDKYYQNSFFLDTFLVSVLVICCIRLEENMIIM